MYVLITRTQLRVSDVSVSPSAVGLGTDVGLGTLLAQRIALDKEGISKVLLHEHKRRACLHVDLDTRGAGRRELNLPAWRETAKP